LGVALRARSGHGQERLHHDECVGEDCGPGEGFAEAEEAWVRLGFGLKAGFLFGLVAAGERGEAGM
jgi:hypothetical protein